MRAVVFIESLVLGVVLTLLMTVRPPAVFTRPPHARQNYRLQTVAGTLGIVLVVPLLVGAAVALAADASMTTAVTIAVTGVVFGIVGLIDDVYGDRHAGGLIGHARALLRGQVTTGTVKAATGAAAGLAAGWALGFRGAWVLAAGAVVALAANLANLFDLRPGRALKVWLASFAALAAGPGITDGVLATGGLAGGAVAFLEADLRERAMLGDGGAAILGGSLGVVAAASLSKGVLLGVLAVLGALTLASEAVSFTKVIDRVPPLRFIDALGGVRRSDRPARRDGDG